MERVATKDKLLEQCVRQLIAIGCRFIILDYCESDKSWINGDLQLAEERKRKTGFTQNRKRWDAQKLIITPIISAMKVGDVNVFQMPEGEEISAFGSFICNQARGAFGGDRADPHYTTAYTKDRKGIELFRIG